MPFGREIDRDIPQLMGYHGSETVKPQSRIQHDSSMILWVPHHDITIVAITSPLSILFTLLHLSRNITIRKLLEMHQNIQSNPRQTDTMSEIVCSVADKKYIHCNNGTHSTLFLYIWSQLIKLAIHIVAA